MSDPAATAPSSRPSRRRRRALATVAGLGFVVGATVSILMPSTGCVIPDKCILIIKPGQDWCGVLEGAMMWPEGQPDQAEPVFDELGGAPVGCACFNDDENQVLKDGIPANYYDELAAEVELAARLKCDSLVPSGFDHNCSLTGPDDPFVGPAFTGEVGECVGDCVYTDDCGDPTPHECEAIVDGSGGSDEAGDTGETGDTGGTDTGTGGTGGVWDPGLYIRCEGNECEVDRAFAVWIWDDPSVLMGEQTRLVFDSTDSRFVIQGVEAGSLPDALGLQDGDVLESVNGQTIDDLDRALEIYAASGDARELLVRVERGTRWVDFTYTFVD